MSINVTIKDLSIDLRAIASYLNKQYWEIRYDEHVQGEILQGCNTYVRCDYDSDILRQAKNEKLPQAKKLIAEYKKADTYYGFDLFENDSFKAIAFYKDNLISIQSKDEEDNNVYARHVFHNEHDLATALVTLEQYGNFGLA